GILLDANSNQNLVINNISNGSWGITLRNSSGGRVINNTVTQSFGIKLESAANNTITGNHSYNNDYWDLDLVFSNDNTVYLNRFERTDLSPVGSGVSTNQWASDYRILFDHETHGLKIETVGNFYGDHVHTDLDNDGIADAAYDLPETEPDDTCPLSQNATFYTSAVNLQQELTVPPDAIWGVYHSLGIMENAALSLEGLLIVGGL
ncbi:MAG: hypothetical protein GY869_30955, partial [Planctomycetes bacterium]|nr:hypothetical protein [Planctomycetota bacterium]